MTNIHTKEQLRAMSLKLYQLRINKGLRREEICDCLDIDLRNYFNLENGNNMPSLKTFIKICQLYNIKDISEFFEIFPIYEE